jgi:hypothetical protein
MIGHRLIRGTGFAIAISATTWAGAGVRTTVTLAGKDDALPKLGMPGIALDVRSSDSAATAAVRDTLSKGFVKLVYTRRLADGEPGDYALRVTVGERFTGDSSATVPFRAELLSADGRSLWRIEGHADLDGAAADPELFTSIGRNVLSAMIHDGWLQPRYDVNDPPPPAPSIRQDDTVVKR